MTLEEVKAYYNGLKYCCLGSGVRVDEISEVLYFVESVPDEEHGAAVVRLADGTFLTFNEWQDYSGHGCQCDCKVDGPFQTAEEALRLGLTEEGRKLFGIEL